MADNTHIEWADATWNPITGCSVTSPGCTNCYAMKLAGTRLAHHWSRKGLTRDTRAGPVWTGEVRLNEEWLTQPLKWHRPRRIFVCAHGDLFHESVPDEWIDRVFAVMALAPQHTFQVLTKRADRMRAYCQSRNSGGTSAIVAANALDNANWLPRELAVKSEPQFQNIWPLPNVWLGVSVEDQTRADERIPDLLATPAAVRWLSCEPLLGPVDLGRICLVPKIKGSARAGIHVNVLEARYVESGLPYIGEWDVSGPLPPNAPCLALDWIIVGGESGPGARPMHPDWARYLRDQCAAAGVPFLFKQWGEWAPEGDDHGVHPDGCYNRDGSPKFESIAFDVDGSVRKVGTSTTAFLRRCGKKTSGRLLDGVLQDAYPQARP